MQLIGNVFPDLNWTQGKRYLQAPHRINLQWIFPKPESSSTGYIHLSTVQNVEDAAPAIRLEINMLGSPSGQDLDSVKTWFDDSHEWIVKAFDDLITENMKKQWGRQ